MAPITFLGGGEIVRVAKVMAPREIRLEEAPIPSPGPGEILVRITAVVLCGSDMQYYAHRRIGDHELPPAISLGTRWQASSRPSDRTQMVLLRERPWWWTRPSRAASADIVSQAIRTSASASACSAVHPFGPDPMTP